MQFYIGILILSFILLGYILLLKEKFNYAYSTGIFLTLTSIMFFMSVFSMLNIMLIGFYLISIIGIGLSLVFIVKNIIQKKFKFSEILMPQNLIYLIMFILIVLVARKIYILMDWDECSYWATMVKRLFYFNSFVGGENFHTFYYPPALSSYQYFIVKILGFQDRSIYFSQYLYIISAMIFIVRNINWKNFIYGILGLLSTYLFIILLLKPYIYTLYSDIPILLTLGCSILFFITHDQKRDIIFIGMMLFNLPLIKSNAFACALLPVAVIGLNIFNSLLCNLKGKNITVKSFIKIFAHTLRQKIYYIILIVIPFLANTCFNLYLKFHNLSNYHTIKSGISDILFNVFVNSETKQIVSDYFSALSSNYTYSQFNLSAILLISLIIIGFIILIKLNNKTSKELESNKFIGLAYFISFFIYVALLLYSYLFLFSRFEASLLASFDRYINAFIGGAGFAFIGTVVYFMQSKNNEIEEKMKKFIIIIFLLLVSVLNFKDFFDVAKVIYPSVEMPTRNEIVLGYEIAEKFAGYFSNSDKVHIISEGEYGLSIWSTIYYMAPLKTYDPRFEETMWSIELPGDSIIENSTKVTGEDYLNYLEKYNFTHVLVIQSNELLYKQYGNLFENLPVINYIPVGIYKFDKENKKLQYIEY